MTTGHDHGSTCSWQQDIREDGTLVSECTTHGTHFEVSARTQRWWDLLAEYAGIPDEMDPAPFSPEFAQWAQDIGQATVPGFLRMAGVLTPAMARVLVENDPPDMVTEVWREVGAVWGFCPPFDIQQPDVPAGGDR